MGQLYLFAAAIAVAYVVGSLLGRERKRADELEVLTYRDAGLE